jgi:thiamine monophosphate kinase
MFNKQQFNEFRQDFQNALKEVSEKYNVTITAGNISYTNIDFTMKVNVKMNEVEGKSFEQAEFEKYCLMFGFSPDDYGKKAVNLGEEYILVGFYPRKRKQPVKITKDGKSYIISEERAKLLFKK